MANKKGGLGRGLGSLLGGAPEGGLSQEPPTPVERIVVESERAESKGNPEKKQNAGERGEAGAAPDAPKASEASEERNASRPSRNVPHPRQEATDVKDIYSNKEDNITIKGVVPRAVSNDLEAAPQRIKSENPNKKVSRETTVNVSRETTLRETDEVDIERVKPNPDQPRTNFKKEELEELAESIKRNGLLQPILVRKVGDDYQIIAGERRWQACKLAGLKNVPVRVREADDDEAIVLAIIENIQRSDLNPIEEAYGYRRMMERGKMTQSQVAQAVSKGRSTIANALRLLDLPEEAQLLLFEERITAGHARAILSIPTNDGREKLTKKLSEEDLSVRETEAIARLLSGKKNENLTPRPKTPKSYKTVARSLRDALQTDVNVRSVGGKNKIEILFKDEADLERLYRILAAES